MQSNNKLRMAIRATAAVAILGAAAQAQAISFQAGDVEASVYGYAQLNFGYDINEDVSTTEEAGGFPDLTGANGGPDVDTEGHFGASASQSRIGLKAKLPTGVTVTVEGDFSGSEENGNNFRLRHAYGTYKGILAGQTWSNYNSFVGNTPTIAFDGNAGVAGYGSRAAQLRYTTGAMSFSIEDPQSKVELERNSTPAFTARLEDSTDGFSYSAAALAKQNSADNGSTIDESVIGYAAFLAAKVSLTDMISIQGAVNYSDGANEYLYFAPGTDAYLDANNDLENISGVGGTIGTSVDLGGGRSVNLSYIRLRF